MSKVQLMIIFLKPSTLHVICRELPPLTTATASPWPGHVHFWGSRPAVQCYLEPPSSGCGLSSYTCALAAFCPSSFACRIPHMLFLLTYSHLSSTMIQWRRHLLNPGLARVFSGFSCIYYEIILECSHRMFAFPTRPQTLQGQRLPESLFVPQCPAPHVDAGVRSIHAELRSSWEAPFFLCITLKPGWTVALWLIPGQGPPRCFWPKVYGERNLHPLKTFYWFRSPFLVWFKEAEGMCCFIVFCSTHFEKTASTVAGAEVGLSARSQSLINKKAMTWNLV